MKEKILNLFNAKLVEKKGQNFGIFEIDSLYPGYGLTIGNALRRVLLSSIPGAAITRVKIKGVSHEFSTIPGVLEDTLLILLNLKKLRFKMFTEDKQKAVLKVKGKKEIKGKDFTLPSQVELVNKDQHIATLTEPKSSLEMEIEIEKGLGYEPVERRKKEKLQIGEIQLDAIYSPVKKVAFKVENMRVGERTDFNKLIMEIETDGTISPEEAFYKANQILVNHFSRISGIFELPKEKKGEAKSKQGKSKKEKTSKPKK